MRYLVTGGAGFIGSHLAAALADGGHEVHTLDVRPSTIPGVEHHVADVRSDLTLLSVGPFDAIFNLAAVHRTPGHEPYEYYDTNVTGAIRTCELAASSGTETIVFVSSVSVYGPTSTSIDERAIPHPVSDYGRSKLQAEEVHRSWALGAPTRRLMIVRPAVVFGPGENGNFTRLVRGLGRKRFALPANGETVKGCGSVFELVRVLAWSSTRATNESEVVNYAYPTGYSLDEIVDSIRATGEFNGKVIRIPMQVLEAGALPFEALARLGLRTPINRERVRKLAAGTNVRPDRLVELGYHFEEDLLGGLKEWLARDPELWERVHA